MESTRGVLVRPVGHNAVRRPAWFLVVVAVFELTSCGPMRRVTPSPSPLSPVDAFACVEAARQDADVILGPSTVVSRSTRSIHGSLATLAQVDFIVRSRAGTSYFTYYLGPKDVCRLGHLDARWQNHSVPLTFTLVGGNLRRINWKALGRSAFLTVVDRWGRTTTRTFPTYPDGLTLWGDGAPLHAAVGSAWRTDAGPDIVVGKPGPLLMEYREGEPFPAEWDVDSQRFEKSPGVYIR